MSSDTPPRIDPTFLPLSVLGALALNGVAVEPQLLHDLAAQLLLIERARLLSAINISPCWPRSGELPPRVTEALADALAFDANLEGPRFSGPLLDAIRALHAAARGA